MSARRRGAPTTSSGTRRTCSRSTRTTPSSAASATATGCKLASRAGETTLRAHDHRPRRAGRRLHDLPPPDDPGQRGHHRILRLGDQLPRVQGDRGAGDARPTARRDWQEDYEVQAMHSRRDRRRARPPNERPDARQADLHGQPDRAGIRQPAPARRGRGDLGPSLALLGPADAQHDRRPSAARAARA